MPGMKWLIIPAVLCLCILIACGKKEASPGEGVGSIAESRAGETDTDLEPKEIKLGATAEKPGYPIKNEYVDEEKLERNLSRINGYDSIMLFSWQDNGKWRYSVFNRIRRELVFAEVSAEPLMIRDLDELKQAFAMLPPDSSIDWNHRDMVYDPDRLALPEDGGELFLAVLKTAAEFGHVIGVFPE
jgi:hypothetical protein